ncbi:Hsp20/alpha crystallin family protein [Parvibaculum sp.]|uniref:Hsp20/alpha crystallin family protein n=1 Tax=Parvibaculum sp. TaxID=2024848 RepID=UPI00320E3386
MPRLLQRFPGHKSTNGELDVFGRLRREMDRLFEDFTQGFGHLTEPDLSFGLPTKVDVSESDDALTVAMELPGLDEKQVDVTLDHDVLVIKGEKKEEHEEKKKDYHLKERRWGSFERRIAVPFHADAAKVRASVKKGVLTVTVPKPAEAKAQIKKIEVKSAS